jgi:nucleoside-diphosphate-sugar epimerase
MALKVLVTGAAGFVGSAMCAALHEHGIAYVAAIRERRTAPGERRAQAIAGAGVRYGERQVEVGNIGADTDWRAALAGCNTVVHLAARVHMMDDRAADKLAAFREVNVDATIHLARQAAALGVRRFVFVSSIKVNGEQTGIAAHPGPFTAGDTPAPQDAYGQSKLEAETALAKLAAATGMELVIVRPPLVYGPGVRANFASLMGIVARGLPLPFGRVDNRRSMVAVDNLVDLLVVCATDPRAAGQVFLVSDDDDVSLRRLILAIAAPMGKKPRLLPVPVFLMRLAARLLGKGGAASRVFGSLQVDIAPTKARLDWKPVIGLEAAMQKTVAHFLARQASGQGGNTRAAGVESAGGAQGDPGATNSAGVARRASGEVGETPMTGRTGESDGKS